MGLYNVMVERTQVNTSGGTSRWLDAVQVKADASEVRDGTLYLYDKDGGEITYYSKYYWRKCERVE